MSRADLGQRSVPPRDCCDPIGRLGSARADQTPDRRRPALLRARPAAHRARAADARVRPQLGREVLAAVGAADARPDRGAPRRAVDVRRPRRGRLVPDGRPPPRRRGADDPRASAGPRTQGVPRDAAISFRGTRRGGRRSARTRSWSTATSGLDRRTPAVGRPARRRAAPSGHRGVLGHPRAGVLRRPDARPGRADHARRPGDRGLRRPGGRGDGRDPARAARPRRCRSTSGATGSAWATTCACSTRSARTS